MVGTIGPIGSGLPQLGLPRLFAMFALFRFVQDVFRMTEVAPVMPFGPETLTNWIHAASSTIQGALWGLSQQTAIREGMQRGLRTAYYRTILTLVQP
jgi:hypothetical protein